MATQKIFSAEEAQKKYSALPQEVKGLLYSPEMVSAIQKAGEKNKLHYDQMGVLEIETRNVMLGFTEPSDYPEALVESLRVNRAIADAIVKDINELLFVKIRESMKTGAQDSGPASKASSVVTPSAASATTTSPTQKPVPIVTSTKPQLDLPAPLHAADVMLSEPTVSLAPKPMPPPPSAVPVKQPPAPSSTPPAPTTKVEPPKPAPYKADPYREPPE